MLTFLASTFRMVTPPFQRRYDWDVPQCEILWEDILRAGRTGATHYLGVITQISPDSAGGGSRRPAEIVDGQQRLATISLLLAVIAANVADDHAPEDYKAEKIRAYFLCNVVETRPERRYKLHLTEHDHDTLLALLHDEPLPVDPSPLLVQNFAWFERQLRRLPPADLQALFRGLELLVIVQIGLVEGKRPKIRFPATDAPDAGLRTATRHGPSHGRPLGQVSYGLCRLPGKGRLRGIRIDRANPSRTVPL